MKTIAKIKKMVVYLITNNVNGKIYVGQDSKNNPSYYGSGKLITQAIEKYGKENFTKTILKECNNKEELNKWEKHFISQLKSRTCFGNYNCTDGGDGVIGMKLSEEHKRKIGDFNRGKKLSEEHKQKISTTLKGRPGICSMLGKTHSEEAKRKIGESSRGRKWSEESKILQKARVLGEKNGMYGRAHSEESRLKMSEKKKGISWGHHSEETKRKISESRKGKKNPMYGRTGDKNPFYGKKHSIETRKKMSESMRKSYERKKK